MPSLSLYFKCQHYKVSWGVAQTKYPTSINLSALWSPLMPCHSIRSLKGYGFLIFCLLYLPPSGNCQQWTTHSPCCLRLSMWAKMVISCVTLSCRNLLCVCVCVSKHVNYSAGKWLLIVPLALCGAPWVTRGIKSVSVGWHDCDKEPVKIILIKHQSCLTSRLVALGNTLYCYTNAKKKENGGGFTPWLSFLG